MPQLDPTWYASQAFWMLLTFCAMFLMIWRFVMPSMQATVDARRSKIENDIRETERLKEEAARLLKELDEAQDIVKKKTRAAFVQAQEDAEACIRQTEEEFNTRLTAHIAEKEQSLEAAKKAALDDIAAISGDLAQAIIRKTAGIDASAEEIKEKTSAVMEAAI